MGAYSLYVLDEEGRILAMEPRAATSPEPVIREAEARRSAGVRVEVWGPAGRVYAAGGPRG